MRIGVIGAAGMLGQSVVAALKGHEVCAWSRQEFDLTDPTDHARLVVGEMGKFDAIVNCAAYTAVDRAETERQTAYDVNAIGVGYLAASSQSIGARLVHISSDFVFDGTVKTPYTERDAVNPTGFYGKSKLAGERALAGSPDALIFRTSWLFGPGGASFARSIINAHRAQKQLRVVGDQIGNPTYAPDLAVMIRLALENRIWAGTYHAAGDETLSWQSFAQRLVHMDGGDLADVQALRTEDWPTPTKRPAFSALNCDKLKQAGAYFHRSLNDSVADFVSSLA